MLVLKHHRNSNKQSIEQSHGLLLPGSTTWTRGLVKRCLIQVKETEVTMQKICEMLSFQGFQWTICSNFCQYWEVKIEEIWSSFSCFSFGILNYRWILIAFRMWDAEDRRNCEPKKSSDPSKQPGKIRGKPTFESPNKRNVLCWWENPQKHPPKKKIPKTQKTCFMLTTTTKNIDTLHEFPTNLRPTNNWVLASVLVIATAGRHL